MRRYIVAWLAGLAAFVGVSTADALEWTQTRPITGMEVDTGPSVATYYFYNGDGWGSAGCPGAVWAYLLSSTAGSRELMALAMQSSQLGKGVRFQGDCVSGYFLITVLYVPPQ
jgi:hypothetical protein